MAVTQKNRGGFRWGTFDECGTHPGRITNYTPYAKLSWVKPYFDWTMNIDPKTKTLHFTEFLPKDHSKEKVIISLSTVFRAQIPYS